MDLRSVRSSLARPSSGTRESSGTLTSSATTLQNRLHDRASLPQRFLHVRQTVAQRKQRHDRMSGVNHATETWQVGDRGPFPTFVQSRNEFDELGPNRDGLPSEDHGLAPADFARDF